MVGSKHLLIIGEVFRSSLEYNIIMHGHCSYTEVYRIDMEILVLRNFHVKTNFCVKNFQRSDPILH